MVYQFGRDQLCWWGPWLALTNLGDNTSVGKGFKSRKLSNRDAILAKFNGIRESPSWSIKFKGLLNLDQLGSAVKTASQKLFASIVCGFVLSLLEIGGEHIYHLLQKKC